MVENKITKVDTVSSYVYDGEGQRVRKLVGENLRFVYDIGGNLIAEFSGATGALQKEYIYGASGLVATIEPTAVNSNGTRYTTSVGTGSIIRAGMENTMRSLTSFSLFCLMLVTGISAVFLHGTQAKEIVMQNLSDEEIIVALESQIPLEAHRAVEEIFHRGERMIPLLLKRRGDGRKFHGYGLGNRSSAFYVLTPQENTKLAKGSVITVEVAALYLISAIYYKTLEFAEAPYLTDGSNVRNLDFNISKRVCAAWISVEKWSHSLQKDGMQSLRSAGHAPLKGSPVYFWGKRD